MKNKLWLCLLAILVITAMLLSACAPKATPQPTKPSAEEPQNTEAAADPEDAWADIDPSGQTVIFWHQHTGKRDEALQEIIAEFNNSNEWGITVLAEYQGHYGEVFDKMLDVLNTPDAPNLVVAYQNQAATYQMDEGLVDMTPLVNSPKWGLTEKEQKDFFPGFWAQDVFPTYGNARLGVPPNRSMEIMYYNADWLKELGYNGPPTTPEEFKEMACKAVEQPFSKATVEGSVGYALGIDASRFASWTFAHGGNIFDYTASRYIFDGHEAQQAMEFIQDLFISGCATTVSESDADDVDFGAGKLLFKIDSSSSLPAINKAVEEGAQFSWNIAVIPHTTPDPVQNIYGASVSLPRTTPEGELAAWLFLKYFTSSQVQTSWVRASNYFPVRASVAEGLSDYFAENPHYKAAFDMLQYGIFEPPLPGYDFVREKVSEALAAIVSGAEVSSTLKTLNEEANTILLEQVSSSALPLTSNSSP